MSANVFCLYLPQYTSFFYTYQSKTVAIIHLSLSNSSFLIKNRKITECLKECRAKCDSARRRVELSKLWWKRIVFKNYLASLRRIILIGFKRTKASADKVTENQLDRCCCSSSHQMWQMWAHLTQPDSMFHKTGSMLSPFTTSVNVALNFYLDIN